MTEADYKQLKEAERSSLPEGSLWPTVDKKPVYTDVHGIFTFGNTKNAVILKDMCNTLDQVIPEMNAMARVSKALSHIDDMLRMVQMLHSERRNNYAGYKEHYVYQQMKYEVEKLKDFPADTVFLFKAVIKEKINTSLRRRKQTYTTHDVYVWTQAAYVTEARQNWKKKIIANKRKGTKPHLGYTTYGAIFDWSK